MYKSLDDVLSVYLDTEIALEAAGEDLDYVDVITANDVDELMNGGVE